MTEIEKKNKVRDEAGARNPGSSRLRVGILVLSIAMVMVLALAAASSEAAKTHLFKETFGAAAQPSFQEALATTVNQANGDVLVLDAGGQGGGGYISGRLLRYKENGEPDPFSALGTNVIDGALGPGGKPCAEEPASCDLEPEGGFTVGHLVSLGSQIAIDESGGPTNGDIYVLQSANGLVTIFGPDGRYLGQITKAGTKHLLKPSSIAVNGSGNVYVGDNERNEIYKYTPTTNPVTNANKSAEFAFTQPRSLAVGTGPSAGYLFVSGSRTSSTETAIYKLALGSGELKYVVASSIKSNSIAVDPDTGYLFVMAGQSAFHEEFPHEVIEEYDVSGASAPFRVSTAEIAAVEESSGVDFSAPISGVAVNGSSGDIYLSSSLAGRVHVLGGPVVIQPDVVAETASGITPTKATLHGAVNPGGQALTGCVFEYGRFEPDQTAVVYEHTVSCSKSTGEIGAGEQPVAVEARITGLTPTQQGGCFGIPYRLVAENANGVKVYSEGAQGGGRQIFCPGSIAETNTATAVTPTTATLNGVINPDGASVTKCLFEYGPNASYGHTVPCAESAAEIGTGESSMAVHVDLTGLTSASTLHFRLVATGGDGTGRGTDESFTTPSAVAITESASAIGATAATLNGFVSPEGEEIVECLFEYGRAGSPYEATEPCAESPEEIGSGTGEVPVNARLTDLSSGTGYHFRLVVVSNATGVNHGEDRSFATPGPRVNASWVQGVGQTEASPRAEIDPNGSATTYHLEWGKSAAPYEHSTTESGVIGSDSSEHEVFVSLQGLETGTAYHYRFVATSHCNPSEPNEVCIADGTDHSFLTGSGTLPRKTICPNQEFRTGASAALPDCRAFEMVSPVDKEGGDVEVIFSGDTSKPSRLDQAASSGEAITYSSARAFGDAQSAPRSSQYLAVRRQGEGWSNQSISPPAEGEIGLRFAFSPSYSAFTEDLCTSWALKETERLLAPGAIAGYGNLYRRDDCGAGGYEALSRGNPSGVTPEHFFPAIEGFSADGARSFFSASGALTPEASQVPQLYEAETGNPNLSLVCILPDGSPYAGECTLGTGKNQAPPFDQSVYHAVSEDGTRAYWSGAGKIYLRENPSRPQSAISGGQCTEAEEACTLEVSSGSSFFWGASTDGSKAIYTAAAGPSKNLFEFDAEAEPPSSTLIAEGATQVMGASNDASDIYFTSTKVLAGANPRGVSPISGTPNLYLYRAAGSNTTFIGTLSSQDLSREGETIAVGPLNENPYFRASRVSPSGQFATFMSNADLTGYDNVDQTIGEADTEVYLFDAAADGGAGMLRCISCAPSGERPAGQLVSTSNNSSVVPMAARLSGWEYQLHPSRVLSADGSRVFFDSYSALVPHDTNGKEDVYEWEAGESQAQCEEVGAELFLVKEGGCLSLISSGESPADSTFVNASADGRDAFFLTSSSLVSQDPGLQDIYDARAGGGMPGPPTSNPQCEGEACQGPYTPPDDPTPSSSTFQGAGNVHEKGKSPHCAKGKVHKNGRCVKKPKHHKPEHQKHKQAGKHHKRANHQRGAE